MELNIITEEDEIKKNQKMFVVRSHIQKQFNTLGLSMRFDVIDMINYKVAQIILDSARRCKKNSRRTVFSRDI